MKFLSLIFLLLMPALALSDVRLGQPNFKIIPKRVLWGGEISFPDFTGRETIDRSFIFVLSMTGTFYLS